jgi:hypothetical protein
VNIPFAPVINLAPAKPLFSLADGEETPKYLCDGLTELLKDKLGKDTDLWKEIAETSEITSNFIQGKQIFQQTSTGWRIQNLRRTNPSKISCINTMQYYATQQIQRIVSMNPDIEPAEEFRRMQYKEKVKKNKAVWNGYERQFYKTWFDHQEALHFIVSGTVIESVQFDHLAQGSMVFKEMWGEKKVPISDGMGGCFTCEHESAYQDFTKNQFPQCPECGSNDVHTEAPAYSLIPSVVGMQPVQMGDLSLKLIPIQGLRFNTKVQVEESSWMCERMRVSKGRLNHILGRTMRWGDAVTDKGLDSLDAIAKAGNTLSGQDSWTSSKTSDDVTIDRLSLKPEDYAHLSTNEEDTVSGEKLPKAKLTKLFPNGVTVIFANEKHVLGVYPDVHHADEASSGVFHMRFNSGIGRGSEDTVEVQKRFNRQDAQMVRAGEAGATPAYTFVEGSVDRKFVKQIGMPGFAVPIKQAVAMAMGKSDLVQQIPPAGIAGQFFDYTYNILDKYRQMAAHAPDVTNNLTGSNRSGTATEAQISDSNAEALYGPIAQQKAAMRKSTATKTLKQYAKYFKGVSKYFTYGTTKQDLAVGENIKGEDVDPNIEFVVVANSERPKTRFTQQQAMATVLQLVTPEGIVMLKQTAPDLLDEILETWDIELSIDDYDTMEDLCWKRLKSVLEVAGEYEKTTQGQIPLVPEIVLLGVQPAIRPTEPDHEQKAKWFSEFLDTPDAQELSEKERDAIDILIMAHRNGGVLQMGNVLAGQAEAQVMGQQPIMDQQSQMAAQQAGMETEAAGAQHEMAMAQGQQQQEMQGEQIQGDLLNTAMQNENAEAERGHAEKMSDKEQKFQDKQSNKEHSHASKMDKSKTQLEREKMKHQSKVAKSKKK